jgi:hypothetical protein
MIEEELKTYLETVTQVKVYAFTKPLKETSPCITYWRIPTEPARNQSGRGDLQKGRFQINVIGKNFMEVKLLAEKVIYSLDCYKGNFESFLISEVDTKEEEYLINLDFYVWYKDS